MVILSTVRSFPKLTSHKQCTLGFIDNEKVRNITQTHKNFNINEEKQIFAETSYVHNLGTSGSTHRRSFLHAH